jgi:hypothetical protein
MQVSVRAQQEIALGEPADWRFSLRRCGKLWVSLYVGKREVCRTDQGGKPGGRIRVKLTSADPLQHTVTFERAG